MVALHKLLCISVPCLGILNGGRWAGLSKVVPAVVASLLISRWYSSISWASSYARSLRNGLLKQATCLCCNHHFCMACIIDFTTSTTGACCPKCDLPATRRQAMFSPEFDKLVAIYQGLELGLACLRPCCKETMRDFNEQEQGNTTKKTKIMHSNERDAVVSPCPVKGEKEAAGDGVGDPNVCASKKKKKRKREAPYRGHPPMSKRVQLPCLNSVELDEHQEAVSSEKKTGPSESEVLREKADVDKEGLSIVLNGTSCPIDECSMPENAGVKLMKDRLCLPCEDGKGNPVIGNVVGIMAKQDQIGTIPTSNHEAVAQRKSKQKNFALDQLSCVFCQVPNDSLVAGPMIHYEKGVPVQAGKRIKSLVSVHQHCAEWAPNVYYIGDTAKNLIKEVARGQKLKCSQCGLKGAVLGCLVKRCSKSYHYPCAQSLSCRWDHGNYLVLCPDHVAASLPCDEPNTRSQNIEKVQNATSETMAEVVELGENKNDLSSGAKISENQALYTEEYRADKPIVEDIVLRCKRTTKVSSGKWTPHVACKLVVCGSGLNSKAQELLASLVNLTRARLTTTWDPLVTHLIIRTDETGAASRTLKFMLATLAGTWILTTEWLEACMAASQLVDEEPFEVNLDIHGLVGGPKRARLLAASRTRKLLEGIEIHFLGEYPLAYKMDLQALVSAAGGRIQLAEDGWNAEEEEQSGRVVVYNAADSQEAVKSRWLQAKALAHKAKAHVVAHTWLLDSIAAYDLQPSH